MVKFNWVMGIAVLALCGAQIVRAENYPVKSISKADQIVVDYAGLPVTIHLANLEFPAGFDDPAKTEISKLLQGQQVKVSYIAEEGMDPNGLPYCYLATSGGLNINQLLVKKGLAKYNPGSNPSKSYHQLMQLAQTAAQQDKLGLWAATVDKGVDVAQVKVPATVKTTPAAPTVDVAPANYSGLVIADLTAKEYVLPGSRYALSIRPGAKIEYKSPEEAERAGKMPSPFCFPDRAKQFAAKQSASTGASASASPEKVVSDSRKSLEEAVKLMQTARELSRSDNKGATANFKKAGKILSDALDRLTPVADANPNDQAIQSLAEEMSMNLYSCNKYQTL